MRGPRPHALSSSSRIVATALALLAAVAPSPAAAASNALSDGSVSPGAGTTETSFLFTVSYTSPRGIGATRVVSLVANQSIDMGLIAGTPDNGVYQATTPLPAGTWPVTFQATAAQGKNPTLAGPTVVVSDVATAPPPPTAAPPPPAPAPAPPVPLSPAEGGGPVEEVPGTEVAAPINAAEPSLVSPSEASPAGVVVGTPWGEVIPAATPEGGVPWTVVVAALATIALVATGWHIVAALRRRRPAVVPTPPAAVAPSRQVRASAPRKRSLADWELYGLDDEPIGTVEYIGRSPSG